MIDDIKLITFGKLARDFYAGIRNRIGPGRIAIEYSDIVDQERLNKYNALAAFYVPSDMNISHISWIHSFRAGADTFLKRDDLNKNVIISRTVGTMGKKIAEYCLCHILAGKQNLYELYLQQRSGSWRRIIPERLEKTKVAILGTGNMGSETARLLSRLDIEVTGVNTDGRYLPHFTESYSIKKFLADPPDIDVLICTLPSTSQNNNLLTEKFFSNFNNIHFINVGRNELVEEGTIIDSINKGYISRATLDVFSSEPLAASSELWTNDRVYITPHQAAITDADDVIESFEEAFKSLISNKRNKLFIDLHKG
jgi:phosphoglycerate dehydrogenase-like enzyme